MLDSDSSIGDTSRASEVKSPIASWPWWKVLGLAVGVYGGLGLFLVLFAMMPSQIPLGVMTATAMMTVILGVLFTIWAWRDYRLIARVGGAAVVTTAFLTIAIWLWGVVLAGAWLWAVIIGLLALYGVAWVLPAVSRIVSALLWREQTAPQTRVGRLVMSWALGIGLAGAGMVGASVGMSLARTGEATVAILIVALGMSAVSVFLAQGFSHQLWPR